MTLTKDLRTFGISYDFIDANDPVLEEEVATKLQSD